MGPHFMIISPPEPSSIELVYCNPQKGCRLQIKLLDYNQIVDCFLISHSLLIVCVSILLFTVRKMPKMSFCSIMSNFFKVHCTPAVTERTIQASNKLPSPIRPRSRPINPLYEDTDVHYVDKPRHQSYLTGCATFWFHHDMRQSPFSPQVQ